MLGGAQRVCKTPRSTGGHTRWCSCKMCRHPRLGPTPRPPPVCRPVDTVVECVVWVGVARSGERPAAVCCTCVVNVRG